MAELLAIYAAESPSKGFCVDVALLAPLLLDMQVQHNIPCCHAVAIMWLVCRCVASTKTSAQGTQHIVHPIINHGPSEGVGYPKP